MKHLNNNETLEMKMSHTHFLNAYNTQQITLHITAGNTLGVQSQPSSLST